MKVPACRKVFYSALYEGARAKAHEPPCVVYCIQAQSSGNVRNHLCFLYAAIYSVYIGTSFFFKYRGHCTAKPAKCWFGNYVRNRNKSISINNEITQI